MENNIDTEEKKGDDTMATIAKPNKLHVVSGDKSEAFIKKFNSYIILAHSIILIAQETKISC